MIRSSSLIRKLLKALMIGACVLAATTASATVITSIAGGGTAHAFSPINSFTSGPVSENGMAWSSTNSYSVYGYTGGYGLASNGYWNGGTGPYIGLNTNSGSMTITFSSTVSSVLTFMNYAPGNGTPIMSIYDANNNLLETSVLNISTPNATNGGADFGFSQASATIKSFVLSNAYIVAANVRTDNSAVPEPGTLALAGLALAGLAMRRRKVS